MSRKTIALIAGLVAIAALAMGYLVWWDNEQQSNRPSNTAPTSFSECVAQNGTVSGSDPRRCTTADGATFAEETTGGDDTTAPTTTYTSAKGVKITVTKPLKDATIKSPVSVTGSVPGNWSFEASFPVKIVDANRNVLGESPASLQGDWMTEADVPFTGEVSFTAATTETGYLILEKANPSGLSENEDVVEIPIKF